MYKMLELMKVLTNRKLWIVLVVMSVAIMFYEQITKDAKDEAWLYRLPSDFQCPLSELSLSPPSDWPSLLPKNIYFVETSEQTKPNFLFMCSVESAARVHPEAKIIVLMKGLAKQNYTLPKCLGISLFGCFANIEIKPLDMKDLFMDTPLANWYPVAQQRWEPYFLPILSDACRLAIMWKFGGIYLDTDFIVLKSLKNCTNVLGIESKYSLNGAFLSFLPRHRFIERCMQDFVANYDSLSWGHQGPKLLTRVFKKWCPTENLWSNKECRGVTILPQEAFYPIRWQDWRTFFKVMQAPEVSQLFKNTYAVHVWNKKSQGTQFDITSKTLLAQLYFQYCPSTYGLMRRYQ